MLHGDDQNSTGFHAIVNHVREPVQRSRTHVRVRRGIECWVSTNHGHSIVQRVKKPISQAGSLLLISREGCVDVVLCLGPVDDWRRHRRPLTFATTCSQVTTLVGSAAWAAMRRSSSALSSSVTRVASRRPRADPKRGRRSPTGLPSATNGPPEARSPGPYLPPPSGISVDRPRTVYQNETTADTSAVSGMRQRWQGSTDALPPISCPHDRISIRAGSRPGSRP